MNHTSRRRIVGIGIVAFWLVMMGVLLRDQLGFRRLEVGAVAAEPLREATESRLSISLAEGRRVGTILVRQAPENRHEQAGLGMHLEARMNLQLLGKATDLDISGSVWRPQGLPREDSARVEFDFAVRSSGFDFSVEGGVADGELRAEIVSAGETLPLRFPVDEDVIFSTGMGSAMRFPMIEVGDEVLIDSFDPLTLSKSRARVRCTAQETLQVGGLAVVTRRLQVETNGLTSIAWIDELGEVVRAETPIGLVVERLSADDFEEPASQAKDAAVDAADGLLDRTAIHPMGLRPFRGAKSMSIMLTGLGTSGLGTSGLGTSGLKREQLPEDRVQVSLGEGRYRLQVPMSVAGDLATDPESHASESLDRHLASDAFIQADHPKIVARAAAITGQGSDPWRRAVAIHDWVFSRLDKEAVLSIPSALEVLEQRRGDCNEHTVLFTALARASALPTRIAIGLVWSDELEGFYYHAWPEVFLGDWVWMDPTLDQVMADATHIKLLNGGIESWPRLLPFLGKLQIEVLEIE